jgi:hypothetical protein
MDRDRNMNSDHQNGNVADNGTRTEQTDPPPLHRWPTAKIWQQALQTFETAEQFEVTI